MDFITYTGSLVCGKPIGLEPTEEICRTAQENGMGALYYHYLKKQLPQPYRDIFCRQQQNACVYMMKQEHELQKFFRKLEDAKLRFVPFKGSDLAFNVYPDPSLRTFGDWDILFHPDDSLRALEFLNNDGWMPKYNFQKLFDQGHHFPPVSKNNIHLEPHRAFPNIHAEPYGLWEYIEVVPGKSYQHRLSAELNILMLLTHAATFGYTHAAWTRLFSDLSYLLQKQNPDIEKLCALAEKWGYPNPVNIIGAFPEFFPQEINALFSGDSGKSMIWREIFLTQSEYSETSFPEWEISSPRSFSLQWLKSNIFAFNKKVHMLKQENPEKSLLKIRVDELIQKAKILYNHYKDKESRKIANRYRQIAQASAKE